MPHEPAAIELAALKEDLQILARRAQGLAIGFGDVAAEHGDRAAGGSA